MAEGGEAGRRAVANAHTIFNVVNTLIFLPLLGWLVVGVRRLVPEDTAPPPGTLEHIDYRFLAEPEAALERAHLEVVRMGRLTLENFSALLAALEEDDTRLLDDVERRDDLIDLLDEILTDYLARLPDERLDAQSLGVKFKLLHVIKDFEHIGDAVSGEMVMLARKKSARGVAFAVGEQTELRRLGAQVRESFGRALEFLDGRDPSGADAVLALERRLDVEQRELYHRHLERLGQGVAASRQSSSIFIDLVGLLRSVHRSVADVVRVLEWAEEAGAAPPSGKVQGKE
jgi:phosphate:Na+ symporter